MVKAYHNAVFFAVEKDNDIDYSLKIAPRAKEVMNQFSIKKYGGNIWELEKFCFQEKTGHEMVDKWYEILKLEALYLFESFCFYMEKNRPPEERFYQPRVNPLRQVVQLIQELFEDKLDEGMVFSLDVLGKPK